MKKLGQKGFTLVEGLLIIIALSLVVGVGYYVYSATKEANKNLTTSPAQATKSKAVLPKKQYLEIKELGIKFELSEKNKDAYYYFKNETPFLSVRYFDNIQGFEGCTASGGDGSGGGIAAIGYAKPGDDHFGTPWTEEGLTEWGGVKIDSTYYWITPNSQDRCFDQRTISEDNEHVEKISDYKKAFTDKQSTLTKI